MDWLRLSLLWLMFFFVSTYCTLSRSSEREADQALENIASALYAGQLDSPVADNAMVRIDAFRHTYPYDYRVLPMAYQWGALMLMKVQRQLDRKEYEAVENALVRLWELVPLTPGLDDMQRVFDATVPGDETPSAPGDAFSPLIMTLDVATAYTLVDNYLPIDDAVHKQFRDENDDNSPPLASLTLDHEMIDGRDAAIEKQLRPLCSMAVQQKASVIVHAEDRVDYRWLMVRLTLCVRRVDKQFRLRHSFRQADGFPAITLHPPRSGALQAANP